MFQKLRTDLVKKLAGIKLVLVNADGFVSDGEPVHGPRDLQRIIATSSPGKTVLLRVMREGKETELSVVVGMYQEPPARERSGR